VRVHVGNLSVTVLIAQFKNYAGTSITNAYEDIAPLFAARIAEDLDVDHLMAPRPWWKCWAKRSSSRRLTGIFAPDKPPRIAAANSGLQG
jgi:hypothetical protein